MIHPVKTVFITQGFGDNPANYSKWNFKGHNGLDYRAFLPDGSRCFVVGKSEIISPHNGKVIENSFDQDGYGWYVKIENDKEGSVLAHMHEPSPLKVGDFVKEGDFVGYQGLTGNTTGLHLHWGYYPIPRNRQNGYGGMIDQEPLINQGGSMAELEEIIKLKAELEEANKNKESLQNQVNGWVRDSQNGTWVSKDRVEEIEAAAYDRGFKAGKDMNPTPDESEWVLNGKTVTTVVGNETTTLNYARI